MYACFVVCTLLLYKPNIMSTLPYGQGFLYKKKLLPN